MHPIGSIYHLYTTYIYIVNWVITCYLPPIKGSRKLHWWVGMCLGLGVFFSIELWSFKVSHVSILCHRLRWDRFETFNNTSVVVSNLFDVYPYLGKWSKLTNICQMGWNHQLETYGGWKKSLTSWEVVYPIIYLQGFLHPRWCRISSINSMWPFLSICKENKNIRYILCFPFQ